jgi:hypothetical protein
MLDPRLPPEEAEEILPHGQPSEELEWYVLRHQ